MAEVNTGSEEQKKGKPQKRTLRVDFTPMVDMNMLLITFFMFCTTLSKPQMMNLVVPAKDKDIEVKDPPKIDQDKTITVILGEDNKCYYYIGALDQAKYENWQSLQETDYSPNGLRKLLVEKNSKAVREVVDLRNKQARNEIPDSTFKKLSSEAKDAKDSWNVMIKPTINATFDNLVKVLDEMQICAIGRYAIVDMTDGDNFLLNNFNQKGALTDK
ncbi:MAG: biopolymer transporter ExbD [Prevotellaceae bacterium]|jgi:biopolymer transport protein ExbD|nr:biopolymer transporter ExbD [Prevotellaceae bacterium]